MDIIVPSIEKARKVCEALAEADQTEAIDFLHTLSNAGGILSNFIHQLGAIVSSKLPDAEKIQLLKGMMQDYDRSLAREFLTSDPAVASEVKRMFDEKGTNINDFIDGKVEIE